MFEYLDSSLEYIFPHHLGKERNLLEFEANKLCKASVHTSHFLVKTISQVQGQAMQMHTKNELCDAVC